MRKNPDDAIQPIIDLYFWLYQGRYQGRSPTWTAAAGAQLKRLVKSHGLAEVADRLGRLFDGQLEWAKEPWTFNLFVHQFDALVPTRPKTIKARDLARFAKQLEENGE